MERLTIEQILQETVMGQGLTEAELQRLAQAGTSKEVSANTLVFREGEPSNSLMVLLEGTTEVLKTIASQPPRQVARLNSGAVVGEIGLFLDRPRQASVRTLTPYQFLVFLKTPYNS